MGYRYYFPSLDTRGLSHSQICAAYGFVCDYYAFDLYVGGEDGQAFRAACERILATARRHDTAKDGPESYDECYDRLVRALVKYAS